MVTFHLHYKEEFVKKNLLAARLILFTAAGREKDQALYLGM